jgi:hypothetical protein
MSFLLNPNHFAKNWNTPSVSSTQYESVQILAEKYCTLVSQESWLTHNKTTVEYTDIEKLLGANSLKKSLCFSLTNVHHSQGDQNKM